MKKAIILYVLLMNIVLANAQTHNKMTIPLLQESAKVDSLMEVILLKCDSNYHYISFVTFGEPNQYFFNIKQIKNKPSGIYYHFMPAKYMNGFGYFKLRGYTIFVAGGIDPYGLFKNTSIQKSFDFIWDENGFENPDDNLYRGDYEYQNGKFSPMNLRTR